MISGARGSGCQAQTIEPFPSIDMIFSGEENVVVYELVTAGHMNPMGWEGAASGGLSYVCEPTIRAQRQKLLLPLQLPERSHWLLLTRKQKNNVENHGRSCSTDWR